MASGTFVSGVSERVTETVAGGRVNGLVVSGSCAVRLSGTQPHASAYIVHLPARNMARVLTHGGRRRQERWSSITCRRMVARCGIASSTALDHSDQERTLLVVRHRDDGHHGCDDDAGDPPF